jgi:hypothetical protein
MNFYAIYRIYVLLTLAFKSCKFFEKFQSTSKFIFSMCPYVQDKVWINWQSVKVREK